MRFSRLAGLILCLGLLSAVPAAAQMQQLDPRTAPHDMLAMQAQILSLQAHMKAQAEDAEAQKATLWQWFLTQTEAEKKRAEAR